MKNVKKKKRGAAGGGRKVEQSQATKGVLGTMKIKENEAHAYGSVFFSVFCVPSNLQG